ncbi:uncharacterized protein I303_103161 [Kwoniella dejecticola CBS 10117]|uniref:Aminoglycoside phosphotransferase domain-containing protein n=1 Tax=Kwoniella dejecticola CBS 10117 TaxID=1296121 RepID=A0A1A6AAT8_9TREE|nr:uncharacterized protein I303_03182 [Kwoniella dejecticola CBS 10117]OBR87158.1 hypothetical protein I303_03182 [Kwoniella dejecticola CBS 10117]
MPELIEWPCDYPDCENTVCRPRAICELCYEVRCDVHDTPVNHSCEAIQTNEEYRKRKSDNKQQYLRGIIEIAKENQQHLTSDAGRLRPNHKCQVIFPTDYEQFFESCRGSGFNVHLPLNWSDGMKWLIRIRQNCNHRVPAAIREATIRSEVLTLNTLRNKGVHAPRAWLPANLERSELDSPELPFDYFFMEFLTGQTRPIPKNPWYPINLPEDELQLFITEYARIQIQLSELPLPYTQIGCLQPTLDGMKVGPIITRGTFQIPDPPYLLGPFNTQKERYLAHIDTTLNYISRGAVSRRDPIDSYLWHLELRELVDNCNILDKPIEKVYLKHDDEKGDHFLWEDGKVVGIIDWEWAYVTTFEEAFATPYIFYEDIDYIASDNIMTKAEKILIGIYERHGRNDLAHCVSNGRLYHRLREIGQYGSHFVKRGFREPFKDHLPPDFDLNPPRDDVDWRVYLMERYAEHGGLQDLMRKHGWTSDRAKQVAEEWHVEKEKKKKNKKEQEINEQKGET